jgi:CheY-like chemotaxis protein
VQKAIANFCKKVPNSELTVAGDGTTAIKHVTEKQFDIIFLDLFMPGISGYETISGIRKLDNGKNTFIVALSGDDIPEEDLKKFSFNSFTKKPIGKSKFEAYINEIKK